MTNYSLTRGIKALVPLWRGIGQEGHHKRYGARLERFGILNYIKFWKFGYRIESNEPRIHVADSIRWEEGLVGIVDCCIYGLYNV